MLKLVFKKILKLSVLAGIVLTFFVLSNLYTYKRFTAEKPIAQISFNPITQQEYDASLRLGDFCEENIYRIYCDEWQIDAEFLKWKSWATLLGMDAMYRLDRLSGRYANINDEIVKTHSAHELKTSSTLDLGKIAERFNNKFPPVDTVYGSSAYEKMQAGVLYTVSVTQSGILIRENVLPTPDSTQKDCIENNAKWKNTMVNLDQKFVALISSIK